MQLVLTVLISVMIVAGALLVLGSAVAMMRERDAFARINVLSPATGLGMPLIVVGAYLQHTMLNGFTVAGLLRLAITFSALLLVSSVASNALARSAYLSGAKVHPDTHPQDLAEDPEGESPAKS